VLYIPSFSHYFICAPGLSSLLYTRHASLCHSDGVLAQDIGHSIHQNWVTWNSFYWSCMHNFRLKYIAIYPGTFYSVAVAVFSLNIGGPKSRTEVFSNPCCSSCLACIFSVFCWPDIWQQQLPAVSVQLPADGSALHCILPNISAHCATHSLHAFLCARLR